ncbi:MAG: cytochrome C oxidase assembly protein, partial [Bacteroidales bacterium]|nr:cytochrome C oxidase assembly protein [Bacteroidales bacterium]
FSGPGTVLTVFALFIIAGFNNTAFYPSVVDLQSSLTIQNASSSHFTLVTMSYVSLLVPFVFAYIYYFWKVMNRKKVTEEELNEQSHVY